MALDHDINTLAVVKDTGYRHLNLVLNMDDGQDSTENGQANAEGSAEIEEEESGTEEIPEGTTSRVITLDGMLPKNTGATAVDVTEQYADYAYNAPEEAGEPKEQGEEEVSEETEESANDGAEESEEETAEPEKTEDQITRTTLAAYSITLSNKDAEIQPDPDHPIDVEISYPRIRGNHIELWHIKDDGTKEQVTDFEQSEGRIAFTPSRSPYML